VNDFRDIGTRLSNWGRWGQDDERGTLNHITPAAILAAAQCIRSGRVFELSLPLSGAGPQQGRAGRTNPVHTMTMLPGDLNSPDGLVVADDMITMPLQCATQWDGLAHVGYDDLLYNGVSASGSVTAAGGAARNGIDRTMPGMVGRAVLLDFARLRGVDWIEAEDPAIEVEELERAEAEQGVRLGAGDALLFRTGWRRKSLVEGWSAHWLDSNPGLSPDCAEWIAVRELAAVASDNPGIEIRPSRTPGARLPLHCILIRDLGMMLGEMFDLEALAEDCARDGQWSFFFCAPPLRIANAAGSPTSPIAVK
jgi:kynurenine formamidase